MDKYMDKYGKKKDWGVMFQLCSFIQSFFVHYANILKLNIEKKCSK